jgi:hypothetical protein
MPCGAGEDAVELIPCSSQGQALGIAVDLYGVDADQIGAALHRASSRSRTPGRRMPRSNYRRVPLWRPAGVAGPSCPPPTVQPLRGIVRELGATRGQDVGILSWAPLTHAIDRFIGRQDSMCEKLVIDHRCLVAVAPYRMPRSGGCVLDHSNLEALLDKVAQMGLDAHIRQHATEDGLRG